MKAVITQNCLLLKPGSFFRRNVNKMASILQMTFTGEFSMPSTEPMAVYCYSDLEKIKEVVINVCINIFLQENASENVVC